MKRKTLFLFVSVLVLISTIHAQDYQISFAGTGASTTVDSVKVENLTQNTSINLSGSDILHLVASVGINELNVGTGNKMRIYPNPMTGFCLVDFEAIGHGKTTIGLYDIAGKRISQVQELLSKGNHTYQISGISNGIYTLKVESDYYSYISKIVSINITSGNTEIKQIETIPKTILTNGTTKSLKSEKSLIDMQYTTGDLLKLTGKSGVFRTVVTLVPSNSQTVTFTFVTCTDADGNNYSVIQIGSQCWMAENLNYGTYAAVTSPQVSGTKFCQNLSGVNDNTCPMGGLYEWANLMQDSASCNGTGAPPNDECVTPVQGLCPAGWHIPSHYEWTTLEKNVGSNPGAFPYDIATTGWLGTDEGGNLKQTGTTNWTTPNTGATNSSGFTALPGGDSWSGSFSNVGLDGYWWSATEYDATNAWLRSLDYSLATVARNVNNKLLGFSVRCVQD